MHLEESSDFPYQFFIALPLSKNATQLTCEVK
jgi:hypothetical protein